MSFGLTGAPNTFQGAMNSTLYSLLRRCALVFFDDILIYSKTFAEHLVHLRQVLTLLAQDKWQVKLSKCRFAQQQISYLGHVVSAAGVATDPSKIQSVRDWPLPQDAKQLRSFLGLAGYYRKFVRHFAIIARPLTDLLKKGTLFVWTADHTTSFKTLQNALVSAPVLALPDFSKPFQLQTDASDLGVGAVLLQDGHPLAFVSKALGPRTRGLSTYDKEYLAVLVAIEHWRSYLQHAEFVIYTDHRSLVHLTEQRLHTPWQLKLYTKLACLQYKIVYKPGTSNLAADALSRHPTPPCTFRQFRRPPQLGCPMSCPATRLIRSRFSCSVTLQSTQRPVHHILFVMGFSDCGTGSGLALTNLCSSGSCLLFTLAPSAVILVFQSHSAR